VFPAATFILFEANADNAPHLEARGNRHFTIALADRDGERTLFLPRTGDVTGASFYVENTRHFAKDNLLARTVAAASLDSFVKTQRLAAADLVKIDVQGAELEIIAGATAALQHCQALIAELSFAPYNKGAPLIAEAMPAIAGHGFRCIDICELHRNPARAMLQADFVFVKAPLFERFCGQAGLR
jgi:FkbM family methyltransferase